PTGSRRGVHDNSCRLYCNGKMIPSNIAPRLMVVVQFENDGSWVARIENVAYAAGGGQPTNIWEVEIHEVMELRPTTEAAQAASTTTDHQRRRKPPGPQPTDDWPEKVKAELLRIALTDPKALRKPNYDALNRQIRKRFGDTNHWLPNDADESEKIIREFLQRF